MNKILYRYGVPITLQQNTGVVTVHGFVQHTATSARKHLLPEYTPLGQVPQGHYLMILPLTYPLRIGQLLMYNDMWYVVRRVERVWLGKTLIYYWCLCEERGEIDQWGR